jgi:outer membrane lipoprotein LolB
VIRGRRRAAAAALLAALLLTVTGCATRPPESSDWLTGRLSVKVDAAGTQPARSLSSAFELRGDADRGELRLTSPLGTLVARARWAPGEAVLESSDGERRFADLDQLARESLGEALPLRALPSWLRGRPWPGADSRSVEAGFEQLGWRIGLARYGEGWLEVTRSSPPAVMLRARLERNG